MTQVKLTPTQKKIKVLEDVIQRYKNNLEFAKKNNNKYRQTNYTTLIAEQ